MRLVPLSAFPAALVFVMFRSYVSFILFFWEEQICLFLFNPAQSLDAVTRCTLDIQGNTACQAPSLLQKRTVCNK